MSDLDRLTRWEASGGTWQVLGRRGDAATHPTLTIALCRCDGGEEVDRFATTDAATVAYVGGRDTSEEPGPELAG